MTTAGASTRTCRLLPCAALLWLAPAALLSLFLLGWCSGLDSGLWTLALLVLAWMAWQVLRFRTVFEQSSQAWSESVAMHERKAAGQDD